jgi:hypothetical protein
MKKSFVFGLMLVCIVFAGMQNDVHAAIDGPFDNLGGVSKKYETVGGSDSTNCGSKGLTNPLKSCSISELFLAIIDILLIFAIPIIVLFIMYAGLLYVTARGDTAQISKAHLALTWAIVGGVIVLAAKLIIEVIQGTVNSI